MQCLCNKKTSWIKGNLSRRGWQPWNNSFPRKRSIWLRWSRHDRWICPEKRNKKSNMRWRHDTNKQLLAKCFSLRKRDMPCKRSTHSLYKSILLADLSNVSKLCVSGSMRRGNDKKSGTCAKQILMTYMSPVLCTRMQDCIIFFDFVHGMNAFSSSWVLLPNIRIPATYTYTCNKYV